MDRTRTIILSLALAFIVILGWLLLPSPEPEPEEPVPVAVEPTEVPHLTLLLCDGSGEAEMVCTHDWLEFRALEWARRSLDTPRELVVITTSSTYGTTVTAPLRHDGAPTGNRRVAVRDLQVAARDFVRSIQIPTDDPARPGVNHSELIAALTLVAKIAREAEGREMKTILHAASDGRFVVSRRWNAEVEVPDAKAVWGALGREGEQFSLSAIARASWCGLNHRTPDGATGTGREWRPQKDQAIYGFYVELFALSGGPTLSTAQDCRSVLPVASRR